MSLFCTLNSGSRATGSCLQKLEVLLKLARQEARAGRPGERAGGGVLVEPKDFKWR